jgi:hypothetical protein
MRIIIKGDTIRIKMTTQQANRLRLLTGSLDKAISCGGASLYAQGGGWYEVIAVAKEYDWVSEFAMAKALMRRIISVVNDHPQLFGVEYLLPEGLPVHAGTIHVKDWQPLASPADVRDLKQPSGGVDASRLLALQARINEKYSHLR